MESIPNIVAAACTNKPELSVSTTVFALASELYGPGLVESADPTFDTMR